MTALHTIAAIVALSVGTASDVRGQHEGHLITDAAAPLSRNASCADGVQKALAIIEGAATRLEAARRTSTNDLRADMADVQRTIAAAQAQLFTCRAAVSAAPVATTPVGGMAGMDDSKTAMGATPAGAPAAPGAQPADAMAGMDHSRMDMGKSGSGTKRAAPGAKAAAPMAGMDHSKMDMGKPAAGAKSAAQGAKPAAPEPIAPMAGMDHSKMGMGKLAATPTSTAVPAGGAAKLPVAMAERIADPACPDNVGKATAAKAVHERRVYYFCSTAARDEFRKNPAAYLKKHPR